SAAPALPAIGGPTDNLPSDAGVVPPPASRGVSGGGGSTSGSTGTGTGRSGLSGSYGSGSGAGSGSGSASSPGAGDATGLAGDAAAGSGSLSAAPVTGGPAQQAVLARDLRGTTKFFYAVIGVAGAMLLASSALWRLKGVKAAWTS
ncbi:MAG: hypothetical protein QOD57_5705, partial [Actinomycetota bacterium]|nr:hypothetical protein [Actinomycetota bacterium]